MLQSRSKYQPSPPPPPSYPSLTARTAFSPPLSPPTWHPSPKFPSKSVLRYLRTSSAALCTAKTPAQMQTRTLRTLSVSLYGSLGVCRRARAPTALAIQLQFLRYRWFRSSDSWDESWPWAWSELQPHCGWESRARSKHGAERAEVEVRQPVVAMSRVQCSSSRCICLISTLLVSGLDTAAS